MLINASVYEEGKEIPGALSWQDALDAALPTKGFAWIGMHNPTAEKLDAVAQKMELHDLVVEDIKMGGQMPKLEEYPNYIFIVCKQAKWSKENGLEEGDVSLLVNKKHMVSFRRGVGDGFTTVRSRARLEPQLLNLGSGYVLYAVLDAVVDRYFPIVKNLEAEFERLCYNSGSPGGFARAPPEKHTMGSWNETCALTRMPIMENDPVVKIHTISVAQGCFDSIHELGSVPLTLGLFSRGTYADYGNIALATDPLTTNNEAWCARALQTNDFWRSIRLEEGMARLIPLNEQQLINGMLMLYDLAGETDEEFDDYYAWLQTACKTFTLANKTWADALTQDSVTDSSALKNVLDTHGWNAFQDRWPLMKGWMHAKNVLMATSGHILIHGDAFNTLVRASGLPADTKRWSARWQEWYERDQRLQAIDPDRTWTRGCPPDWAPLTKPFRTSGAPVHAHYWHTVEPEDALQSIGLEDLLQVNAFTKGICHTRVNLQAGYPGGQDKNRTLLTAVVGSVRPR